MQLRQNLKERIKTEANFQTKQNLEIRAELIKLMLNSCYGYTLCNLTSNKFKHFENRRKSNSKNILFCIQIDENTLKSCETIPLNKLNFYFIKYESVVNINIQDIA